MTQDKFNELLSDGKASEIYEYMEEIETELLQYKIVYGYEKAIEIVEIAKNDRVG